MDNIFPIFDTILSLPDKQKLLNQKSLVVWIVGLSGSGKSTLARGLENELYKLGYLTQILDGDNLRSGINNNLKVKGKTTLDNKLKHSVWDNIRFIPVLTGHDNPVDTNIHTLI